MQCPTNIIVLSNSLLSFFIYYFFRLHPKLYIIHICCGVAFTARAILKAFRTVGSPLSCSIFQIVVQCKPTFLASARCDISTFSLYSFNLFKSNVPFCFSKCYNLLNSLSTVLFNVSAIRIAVVTFGSLSPLSYLW